MQFPKGYEWGFAKVKGEQLSAIPRLISSSGDSGTIHNLLLCYTLTSPFVSRSCSRLQWYVYRLVFALYKHDWQAVALLLYAAINIHAPTVHDDCLETPDALRVAGVMMSV